MVLIMITVQVVSDYRQPINLLFTPPLNYEFIKMGSILHFPNGGQKPLRSLSPTPKTGMAVRSPSMILQGRSLSPSSIFKSGQKPLRDFTKADIIPFIKF